MKENYQLKSKIPQQALEIITEFEGFRANPYNDGLGVATIGIGTTRYPNGRRVTYADPPISEAVAKEHLRFYLKRIIPTLAKIPYWQEMNSNQQSALFSFAYNLGEFFYRYPNFSSITLSLEDKSNWHTVPKAMLRYVNPGTNVEAGLRKRRKAEGELWEGKGKFAL